MDKKLTLFADMLIRLLACRAYGLNNCELSFCANTYEKPALEGYPEFHFNISHTHNAITVAMNDAPVGIDVEQIRQESVGIAEHFFTPQEQQYIYQSENDKDMRFFEVWTKKEAYVKYTGRGLSLPMNTFCVINGNSAGKLLHSFHHDNYVVSVCSDELCRDAIELIHLTETDILRALYESHFA